MLSRRDFLKLASLATADLLLPKSLSKINTPSSAPNFIILLCDAFSARHLSLHGYPRRTTPYIDLFAERSTVFHNHYSGGNFTTTGTATMLTGMLPWKHRAINYGGLVSRDLAKYNFFSLLGDRYKRLGFSQNPWPVRLMSQYSEQVDRFLSPYSYSQFTNGPVQNPFSKDFDISSVALDEFALATQHEAYSGSSIAAYLFKSFALSSPDERRKVRYPSGFPTVMGPGYYIPYLNEEVYDGVWSEISSLHKQGQPYFAYFHLYSPHFPFRPNREYRKRFREDGFAPVTKPVHPLSAGLADNFQTGQREVYDKQIAQVDDEIAFLVSRLADRGMLDNTYLILTSDHGELFERGIVGHGFQFLYEPVLRIPLIIHSPGQTRRVDVHSPTSNTDLLPTLLSLSGTEIPAELDGQILPGFGGSESVQRPIFSMVGVDNSSFAPITKAALSMRKGRYKLIAYLDYNIEEVFELYNLDEDPEELENLYSKAGNISKTMKDELFFNLNEANKRYEKR